MSHIHWYPGHIARARRDLKEKLNLVDVVLEIIDARTPVSGAFQNIDELLNKKPRLILLNKVDLVDLNDVKNWQKFIENETKTPVLPLNLNSKRDIDTVISKILTLYAPIVEKFKAKGILPRAARVMVIGLPNVGKSSVINRLCKCAKTKTGAHAGVTRQQQWVRVHPKIDLLDTPGVISSVQDDQKTAIRLAIVNSVGEKAYDSEFVASELLKILDENYPKITREYYKIGETDALTIENIAHARNWIIKGANPDVTRASEFILSNFRDGKIGKIILDKLPI